MPFASCLAGPSRIGLLEVDTLSFSGSFGSTGSLRTPQASPRVAPSRPFIVYFRLQRPEVEPPDRSPCPSDFHVRPGPARTITSPGNAIPSALSSFTCPERSFILSDDGRPCRHSRSRRRPTRRVRRLGIEGHIANLSLKFRTATCKLVYRRVRSMDNSQWIHCSQRSWRFETRARATRRAYSGIGGIPRGLRRQPHLATPRALSLAPLPILRSSCLQAPAHRLSTDAIVLP